MRHELAPERGHVRLAPTHEYQGQPGELQQAVDACLAWMAERKLAD